MNGYDNWKMASEHEDAPPLDAECEGCGQEDYQGNLVDGLCQDCHAQAGPDFGECPDAYDARIARNKERLEIIEHGLRSDHD